MLEKKKKYPSQKFAGAQIAEGENNDEELLQSQVGQEENRHLGICKEINAK